LPDAPPAHPLLQAVAPLAIEDPDLPAALFAVNDGIATLLDLPRFADTTEREAAYDAVHGPLWALHARWCGVTAGPALAICRRAGVLIELARALCELRRVVGGGVAWLCRSHEPQTPGLGDADWYAEVAAREIGGLLPALAASARAVDGLSDRRAALRPLRVLLDLSSLTLQEIAADGYRVWERRIELTPLRKLWRALRIRFEV
jgi:phytoene synthase